MPPSLSTRIRATLRRPRRVTVARYLAARRAGDLAAEDEFFWQLQLASGVFKATNRRRFDDTFALLRRALPADAASLRVLDVACSSGISTVELHQALARPGLTLATVGTDIATMVWHAALADGAALVYDLDGNILGAEIDGMLINRHPNRAVRLHHPWRVRRAHQLIAAHQRPGGFTPAAGATVTEVPLVSSAVARTAGVEVVEEDLRTPTVAGPFGLIRAANVLNRGYFSDAQLRECVAALLGRLGPDALLFVVRTAGATNHGTLWRWRGGALTAIDRIGDGSDIAALVEDVARTTNLREPDHEA